MVDIILAYVIRMPHVKRNIRNRVRENRTTAFEWVVMPLTFVGMQLLPVLQIATRWLDFADWRLPPVAVTALGLAGMTVFALGLWLLWRAHADLGRNWSSKVQLIEGQKLVTTGVYRYIRHPIYAAHWLWALAQPLLLQNWIAGLAGLVTYLPAYFHRVPREEEMLVQHFGDEYLEYIKYTGRVLPIVRR